jgi:hypothetical protein
LLAKSDVDNVGAGRAAKGASPGRSTSSLFRRYAPYCLNHGKSFETKGFQSFFLLSFCIYFAFRSTLRSTEKELLTSSAKEGKTWQLFTPTKKTEKLFL